VVEGWSHRTIPSEWSQTIVSLRDEPRLKATFTISIKNYRNFTVLSNMPILWTLTSEIKDFIWTLLYYSSNVQFSNCDDYDQLSWHAHWQKHLFVVRKMLRIQSSVFGFARKVIRNITLLLQSEFSGINIPKMGPW